MNRSATSGPDFNQFANGGWLARDTIPAAYPASGVSRDMSDRNELVVRSVLDDAMRRAPSLPAASTERKLGTFYGTCMDSAAAEREGVRPVKPLLTRIGTVSSRAALVARIAEMQRAGGDVAFGFGPDADLHDAAHYTAFFAQGGLGLPDRDYYTNTGAEADSIRREYLAHIAKLFVLSGASAGQARADAKKIMTPRDLACEGLAHASRVFASRRTIDHPIDARGAREDGAGGRLDCLSPRGWSDGARDARHRDGAGLLHASERTRADDSARGLAGLSSLPRAGAGVALAQRAIRE